MGSIGFVVVNYLCWLSQGVFYGAIKKKDCRCEYLMRHVNLSHFMTGGLELECRK